MLFPALGTRYELLLLHKLLKAATTQGVDTRQYPRNDIISDKTFEANWAVSGVIKLRTFFLSARHTYKNKFQFTPQKYVILSSGFSGAMA